MNVCVFVYVCVNDPFACILRKISLNVINLKQQKREREIYLFTFMFCKASCIAKNLFDASFGRHYKDAFVVKRK